MTTLQEYNARTQFIRLIAMSAKHANLNWFIVDRYVRQMLTSSTNIKDTSLSFFITPYLTEQDEPSSKLILTLDKVIITTKSMIKELEVMKAIKTPQNGLQFAYAMGNEPLHAEFEFEANINISDNTIKFPVIFKVFPHEKSIYDDRLYPFSTDTIYLGENGLNVFKQSLHSIDTINQFNGISLMERIINLKQDNQILQLHEYDNHSGWFSQAHNANLLKRTEQLTSEGFHLKGDIAKIIYDCTEGMCPICQDVCDKYVSLECTHAFCIKCITNHMILSVYGAKCPMCRSRIMPSIETI